MELLQPFGSLIEKNPPLKTKNGNLNNKASELISRLVHMYAEQNIPYIEHTNSVQPENHLNESMLQLNRYRAITQATLIDS